MTYYDVGSNISPPYLDFHQILLKINRIKRIRHIGLIIKSF